MKSRLVSLVIAALAATLLIAEADITGAKCPIGRHQAMAGLSVDYKGGKVYFCCDGCPQSFQAEPAAYAVFANQQLFATGQAKQIACPISGKPISKGLTADVDGKAVAFADAAARDKVKAAEGDEQLELVFSDEAFARAFKVGD